MPDSTLKSGKGGLDADQPRDMDTPYSVPTELTQDPTLTFDSAVADPTDHPADRSNPSFGDHSVDSGFAAAERARGKPLGRSVTEDRGMTRLPTDRGVDVGRERTMLGGGSAIDTQWQPGHDIVAIRDRVIPRGRTFLRELRGIRANTLWAPTNQAPGTNPDASPFWGLGRPRTRVSGTPVPYRVPTDPTDELLAAAVSEPTTVVGLPGWGM